MESSGTSTTASACLFKPTALDQNAQGHRVVVAMVAFVKQQNGGAVCTCGGAKEFILNRREAYC